MTVDQVLQIVHRRYDGDTTYPSSSDDDYLLRLGLLQEGIRSWVQEVDTDWKELYTDLSSAADGDKTTDGSASQFDCPTNFLRLANVVYLEANSVKEYYPVKQLKEVRRILANNTQAKICWITGTRGAYKINFNPTPLTGKTIQYPYFKTPTIPTSGSDQIEMSKPLFLAYFVLAQLFEQDNRNDMVTYYDAKAQGVLEQMMIENEVSAFGVEDSVDDYQRDTEGFVWGE